MILLALDTCDPRGSLAVLREHEVLSAVSHEEAVDYSSWILMAAQEALSASQLKIEDVDVFAAAAGPGSFTGVRVGLTTVKAWSEVYGVPIAAISRLEAIASQATAHADFVASFFDAQREQVFGGLYQRTPSCAELAGGPGDGGAKRASKTLQRVGDEMVGSPQDFLDFVRERTSSKSVAWASLDPEKLSALLAWRELAKAGVTIQLSQKVLAPWIGRLGLARAEAGQLQDALTVDAQYVRRCDAEIFWKGAVKRGA